MNADRRLAYLRAMGLEVWVPRAVPAVPITELIPGDALNAAAGNDPGHFTPAAACYLEPGSGDTLLLCGDPEEARMPVARDIARSIRNEPVWGWPVATDAGNAISLEQAIRERLITRLVVFGFEISNAPDDLHMARIGTAETLKTVSLPELARSGKARKALWEILWERRWLADRARPVPARRAG